MPSINDLCEAIREKLSGAAFDWNPIDGKWTVIAPIGNDYVSYTKEDLQEILDNLM